MATKTIGRAAIERAAIREHIDGCRECVLALLDHDNPFALCATGTVLWDRYQEAKMARLSDAVISVARNAAGEITGVAGLDTAGLAALHNYLGAHVCGCHDAALCGCVQYGYDLGCAAKREPLR